MLYLFHRSGRLAPLFKAIWSSRNCARPVPAYSRYLREPYMPASYTQIKFWADTAWYWT